MDKNAIKKYAVWARRELIERVAKKAQQFGIEAQNIVDAKADTIHDKILTASEKRQRQALIERINEKEKNGYEQVMEEVAYTWFNRFSALRFMEVNGYLPTHVRVFTDEANNFKPQILTEAIHLDMDGLDMEKVYAFKDANKTDELYKYLLITQCNALSSILPGMFQKIEDYTELLFPDNLLREGSVIEQMVALIPETDWKDAVQIIGWLYQFYNIEPKEKVFARSSGKKVTKDEIPAATQLFTPDWIVRYMVENSLGRLWIEGHPNDELKAGWKYYIDEAEQDMDVQMQLDDIRKGYVGVKPENIKCIDPCSGSGHILVYMFDVFMQIYETYGYTSREAAVCIVENNIYGLDIDERAAQLASFAVMMKARQYDRRFFSRGVQPHVYSIVESNNIDSYAIEYFCNDREDLSKAVKTLIKDLDNAKEYGSILNPTKQNWTVLYERLNEIKYDIHIARDNTLRRILPLVRIAEVLTQKYDVVVTNPPYIAVSIMNIKVYDYIKKNYPDSKTDLFAVFIEKCWKLLKVNGYQAMITMHAWMFLSSFEKLRKKLLEIDTVNMLHLGARAFEEISGEVVQTTSFVLRNTNINEYRATYCRLIEPLNQHGKELLYLSKENRYYIGQAEFYKIPGAPVVYWITKKLLKIFNTQPKLGDKYRTLAGSSTGDNNRFLRLWYEVECTKTGFNLVKTYEGLGFKWIPAFKGGGFHKWYGNIEYLINWENNGEEIKYWVTHNSNDPNTKSWSRRLFNTDLYFHDGLTWSKITTGKFSARYMPEGFIMESASCGIIPDDKEKYIILALLNSNVVQNILKMLNPTVNIQVGDIMKIPIPYFDMAENISKLTLNCILLSQIDWDSFETSWNFLKHPLVIRRESEINHLLQHNENDSILKENITSYSLDNAFTIWRDACELRFNQLKKNEEELNEIFIDIYGLKGEVNIETRDEDITIRKADLQRDIKSLISYSVGCMLGRYSLDVEGLAYAGGEWDNSKYSTYSADKDNIIPICDDEYFEDDIAGRFIKFIEVVYGENTLQENLKFIADALGGKGQPKEVIRSYFLNNFYKDHCKIYQKRPIYWQFDSGKKNGFKCLIYMHRYEPDTIARIRTDYVHEQQSRYRTAIEDLEKQVMNASTSERVKLNKKLLSLQAQATEIREYEEKIHHLADQMIRIDLDDGVKKNYEKFKDVLAKIN